jgi:hypothetical protein
MSRFVVEYLGNGNNDRHTASSFGFDAYTTFTSVSGTQWLGSLLLFGRLSPDVASTRPMP